MGFIKKLVVLPVAILGMLPTSAQESKKVVFFSAQQMANDIRKAPAGSMGDSAINLIERTPGHAGILARRTKPGKAEVHETQADVLVVLDGGCTLVTGGTVIAGAQTEPGEIRGSGIQGGEEHQLAKGDFIRIPAGVPHWVKKITGNEIVYLAVKYADKDGKD